MHRTISGTSFVRSLVLRKFFSSSRKVFRPRENFYKNKFGPTRSIPSKNRGTWSYSRDFQAVSSFENSHATFWRFRSIVPRLGGFWFIIRTNPRTIGRIRQKVACTFFLIGAQEMSCLEHRRCPAWNTRKVLLGTHRMS